MKRYDMPKIEIDYFERESVITSSGDSNAADEGKNGLNASITTNVGTLFGKQQLKYKKQLRSGQPERSCFDYSGKTRRY